MELAGQIYGDPNKPSLVLLHGFLGDKSDWLSLLPYLTEHFYCVCLDLPGHGDSKAISLPIPGFNHCCELIINRLDKLNIHQFAVLGYSLGGRIALHLTQYLAKRESKRLTSVYLESCHPGLTCAVDKKNRAANDANWSAKLRQLPFEEFLALWYQQAVFAELSAQQRLNLISKRKDADQQALVNCFQATSLALQADLSLLPAKINVPCQLIIGKLDNKFMQLGHKWQHKTQLLKLISIDNAGHNVHLAQPYLLAQAILSSFPFKQGVKC